MRLYKYDTHVHTQEVSECGKVKAGETVRLYHEAGYDGIVITDHYYRRYFDRLEGQTWNEKIDFFLSGYNQAKVYGRKLGVDVILGMEIRFEENVNDYLVYGIYEDFLKENKELYKLTLTAFKELVKHEEILIIQAHPFRTGMIPANPTLIDGVEVFNEHPRHDSRNHLALAFARQNGRLMLSGSDFHQAQDAARGGIVVPERISDSQELVKVIKEGRIVELLRTK
ncbi:PHP domain-containing protein [Petroclostridium sp. X23]|uniref:PHP domain-containing protein n=1 Tax=Petroclostridium sp. X23 TaxID=3045146 RepID=UPI0024ADEBDE|nr:PHP domain-containing protein [Petroclostridium sp. X23]WHH59913.1 PHP-associated domain-containing protein [Petroclostridium sp. X23]